jgi:small subunit ribosomal protein S4
MMTGPRLKKIRRLGTPLPGLTRKVSRASAWPAGAHAASRSRRYSDYRRRLEEKQKVRWHYGVSEGQLRSAFARAVRKPGATGENLLALLERRLDNVVFRLGLAPTIPAARQLVAHGHVQVDGERVDRAGYGVKIGAEISISGRGRRIPDVTAAVKHGAQVRLPRYLELDPDDPFRGRVVGAPVRADVPFLVEETAIVEFYAR